MNARNRVPVASFIVHKIHKYAVLIHVFYVIIASLT